MRLDGGHPALDLVNTIYGQVGGPVEADVLATPGDLVTFARRVGMAGADTPAGAEALAEARALRDALDPVLRSLVAGAPAPTAALAAIEAAGRAAIAAASLDGARRRAGVDLARRRRARARAPPRARRRSSS